MKVSLLVSEFVSIAVALSRLCIVCHKSYIAEENVAHPPPHSNHNIYTAYYPFQFSVLNVSLFSRANVWELIHNLASAVK